VCCDDDVCVCVCVCVRVCVCVFLCGYYVRIGWGDDDFTSSSDKFSVKLSKKEIKKLKKDAEKERVKRTSDPFYLGAKKGDDSTALMLVDEEEVEAIPIFKLSDDEGKKKKKKVCRVSVFSACYVLLYFV
jgi:hypothetical protein